MLSLETMSDDNDSQCLIAAPVSVQNSSQLPTVPISFTNMIVAQGSVRYALDYHVAKSAVAEIVLSCVCL